MSRKEQDIKEAKTQKKIAKEKEKDRKKRRGDNDAARKHIVQFDKRHAKYKALVCKAKDEEKHSAAETKI